ncbi:MAG: hypothetical protein LW636_01660 [Planctomycetaceae bacterium]|nr:hypothetical protein [Planctomycetaceae bacterium]
MRPEDEFTVLLHRAAQGDSGAANSVWDRAYAELHAMARGLRPNAPGAFAHVPGATTIIHEAFIKAFGGQQGGKMPEWDNRRHFFGSVARAMGQFIVDWHRTNTRQKRGGGQRPASLGDAEAQIPDFATPKSLEQAAEQLTPELHEAMQLLEAHSQIAADVIWLRYVAGLSIDDTASVLEIDARTVSKHWNYGRAWLRRELTRRAGAEP